MMNLTLWQRKLLKAEKVKPNYKRKLATERDKVKRKYSNKKIRDFPYLFYSAILRALINMDRKY